MQKKIIFQFILLSFAQLKGAYIEYVGGGAGGFYKFFKKKSVPQQTILRNFYGPVTFLENISWPLPSILISYLRLSTHSNIQITKEVNIHNNI